MKRRFHSIVQLITFFAAVFATLNYVNERTIITALVFWLTYVLYCIGIMTAKELAEFKGNEVNRK